MRASLNWIKEYVNIDVSPQEMAEMLTMAGLEVEAVEPLGHSLDDILAARILSVEPHPQADTLSICHVDSGKGEFPVVSGAPNLFAGAMVPMALPGTKLPKGKRVEEARIRGERSVGMLLAEDEMGLTDDHTGIMILPPETELGSPICTVLPLEDFALEISLTPNRPDCASILGIAREIAALTGQALKEPEVEIEEGEASVGDLARVTIDDPKGCPRYAAGVIQAVDLKASPFWLRYRLHACGLRGINNVVDVTNFVLLEMGQPLHAFDYDRLNNNRIVVRRAKDGEIFTTLDGKTHALTEDILLICDDVRPVALAGIMGGLNSEIFQGSRNVLLESACFDPVTIRKGSKGLDLFTEASYRFERGVDIDGAIPALKRALMLISRLAGGVVARGIIDCYPRPSATKMISLRVDRTNHLLGTSLSREEMADHLKSLEMEVQNENENVLRVRPPSFRVDISREEDLMEEVARMEGYDRIPVSSPAIKISEEADSPEFIINSRVRDVMAGLGFTEVITYSFVSPDSADFLGVEKNGPLRSFVRLLNPLTIEQSVMRTSLLPGLLSTIKTNLSHDEENLKIFELGPVFFAKDEGILPNEKECLAGAITGLVHSKTWYSNAREVDFFDIKGAVEGLLKSFGLGDISFREKQTMPGYDPEASCSIFLSESSIGHVGRISQEVLEGFQVDLKNAYAFEIDMEFLIQKVREPRRFRPFSRFPAVIRDISMVVEREVESAIVLGIIAREGGDLVESVSLFDLFHGKGIDPSEKAVAFRICYRSNDRTLDGKEVNQLTERIISRISQETGGRLREA